MELQNTRDDLYAFMDAYTADMSSKELEQFAMDMFDTTGYYLDSMSFETFYMDGILSCKTGEVLYDAHTKPYGYDEDHTFEGLKRFLANYKA